MANARYRPRGDTAANWAAVNPVLEVRELGLELDTGIIRIGDGATAWNSLPSFVNATVSSGDKGDITVSGGTWAIDNGVVTLTKMANLAANSIIGNNTGAPATPSALTALQTRTLLGLNSAALEPISTFAVTLADRTALAGYIATTTAFLREAGREGMFVWDASNLATKVTSDPGQGIYVPPTTDTTGASGAWVRKHNAALNVKWFGAKGDNATTDDTVAIQRAADYANSITGPSVSTGGGWVYFPASGYKTTGPVRIYANARLTGDGRTSSWIKSNHAGTGTDAAGVRSGSAFYSQFPINSSTGANIEISHLGVENTSGSNVGAAYYDTGGTYLHVHDCEFRGFKYNVVLEQTELWDIDLCNFNNATRAGVWIANGNSLTVGASGEWTNRGSIHRCQFNQNTTSYCILDDGGDVHAYEHNNYNGGLTHIRAAGVGSLIIRGGEWESCVGPCVVLEYRREDDLSGVGGCLGASIRGGFMVPTAGQPAIKVVSGSVEVGGGLGFSTSVAAIQGMGNGFDSVVGWVVQTGGGAIHDGYGTNGYDIKAWKINNSNTVTAPANVVATGTVTGSNLSGTNTGDQFTSMTSSRILGRVTAGFGAAEQLTGTQTTALLDTFSSTLKGLAPSSGGGTTNFLRADGTWAAPSAGGGAPPDADYGDVTVAAGVWTIDNGVVSLAKMANMATASLIYRKTAGTGAPEVNTLATLKTDLGLTGTNSGDQTITLSGDVSGSGTGAITTVIGAGKVTLAMQANLAANSILGNNTGSAATPIALTASQTKTLLALAKGDVGLGNVDNTSDANKPVSTAQQTALDLKANLAGAAFTGAVSAPNTYVGYVTPITYKQNATTLTAQNQTVTDNSQQGSSQAMAGFGFRPSVSFMYSLNTTKGSHTAVNSTASDLGNIEWYASDGTEFRRAAYMTGRMDNTTLGTNGWQGRIVFLTGAPTTGSMTQRMAIHTLGVDVAGALAVTGAITGSNLSNTNTGDQTITLTGDVTGSGTGSFAATIGNDKVTYAQMQNVSATNRFLGRITAAAGDPEELTGTQATSLLDTFTTALKGLAPASGGGTTNFLRADGTWAAPPGGGGGVSDGDKGDVVVSGSGTVYTVESAAGNFTVAGGNINLANATSNTVNYGTHGVGAPTVTTRSAGTKAIFYDALTTGAADYAMGVAGSVLWFGVPQASAGYQFQWYGGATIVATLSDIGDFNTLGAITGSNLSGTNTGNQTITLTGDVTGSGTGSFAATLATVNANTGSFGSATAIPTFTVNGKGLITAAGTAANTGGWTEKTLATDYTGTTSFVDITDGTTTLTMTPTSNANFEIQAVLLIQTSVATNLPRVGVHITAQGTGAYGAVQIDQTGATVTTRVNQDGTFLTTAVDVQVPAGGVAVASTPYMCYVTVRGHAGASPAAISLQMASETTPANNCKILAGSQMRYKVT